MQLELSNKTVLVTGGSKGIGLACARGFLAEGARVAIASRSRDNLARAAREMPGLVTIAAELIDEHAALGAVDEAERALGPLDVLVNSAGAARRTAPEDLTPRAWRDAMDAKYFTYINVIDPVVKRMAARGHGVIVSIVGQGGKVATGIHMAGGAANAALMLATAGLAHAYAKHGVRVLAVNPGLTDTDRVAEGMRADAKVRSITEEEALRRAVSQIAIGRMASPEEIANVVVFAASPRASYLTGVSISMDGASMPIVI